MTWTGQNDTVAGCRDSLELVFVVERIRFAIRVSIFPKWRRLKFG